MPVISGKNGTVSTGSAVTDVLNWRLNRSSNNSAFATSNTAGYKNRVAGTADWSGSISVVRNTNAVIQFVVGSTYNLVLTEDGTKNWNGAMIVDSLEEMVNIDTGDYIGVTVNFSGNGALTPPA